MDDRTRDRRNRNTFWIDDRVVDTFGPVMGHYAFGATALAVYAVLARRADRDGESWPSIDLIAAESGSSVRTVHKALRLLELLGLVEIAARYERGSQRQTSNLYTLLTPPERPPEIDPDPEKWPPPARRTVHVGNGNRADAVATARVEQRARGDERPAWTGLESMPETAPPLQAVHPPPCNVCTLPLQSVHPPPATAAPLEGNTSKDNTKKEECLEKKTNDGTFTIAEVGLSNRQVWAATLGELARRGAVGRADLEVWLRPAGLIGREGEMLIVGAPNAVSRDRIATRFLPAVREAVGVTIGAPVTVSVVVAETGRRESSL